jgi:cysteine desulfurase / selenocysteine lyase
VRHGHHCTMPLHSLFGVPATTRASFGVYTTRDDIDALVEAIDFARQKVRRA